MNVLFLAIAMIVVARWFFRSPLADAVAESLRRDESKVDSQLTETVQRVGDELTQLRVQVSELAERVDFTERALADVRRRGALNA